MTRTKRSNHGKNRGQQGSTLVIVVGMIATLMLLGLAFVDLATKHSRSADEHFSERRAFYLADAGINEAVHVVRLGGLGSLGSMATPVSMGGGLFWVEVTDLGGNQVRLVSTALVESGRAAIEVIIDLTFGLSAPLFESLLNSDKPITLSSGVLVDSFDSAVGTYASQATNTYGWLPYAKSNAIVRANENVVMNSDALIFGDATPGPGYTVTQGTGAYVSGSTDPAAMGAIMPAIEAPVLVSSGPLTVPPDGVVSIPAGQHAFDALTLGRDSTLRIEGPADIVVSSFLGGKEARLEIDARLGPVTIYCMGAYTHLAGFEALPAVSDSPMALAFMIEGPESVIVDGVETANIIVFPSGSLIRGAYYAPNTEVIFTSDNEFWGAITGGTVSMASGMRFHFDEDLMQHWQAETGQGKGEVDFVAWYESSIPAALAADRSDPYDALDLTAADTLTISAARAVSLAGTP